MMRDGDPADANSRASFERDDLTVCREWASVQVPRALEPDLEGPLVLEAEGKAIVLQGLCYPFPALEIKGSRKPDVHVAATLIRRR
jgi:hypothetical protein